MQGLTATWADEHRRGFDVYDVVVEDFDGQPPDADDAAAWQDAFALPWPVVFDADGAVDVLQWSGTFPASWLVDRHGRIVLQHDGGDGIEAIEAALLDL